MIIKLQKIIEFVANYIDIKHNVTNLKLKHSYKYQSLAEFIDVFKFVSNGV